MNISRALFGTLFTAMATTAAASLTACGGNGGTAAAIFDRSDSVAVRAEEPANPLAAMPATEPLLYISSYEAASSDGVYVYRKDGPSNQGPLAKLEGPATKSNDGIAVDRSGNLYVTNRLSSQILYYPSRSLQPTKTLSDPGEYPGSVAVGNDGTVYVGNQQTTAIPSGPGGVVAYAPGHLSPTKIYHDAHFGYVEGVFVDGNNNVYAAYRREHGIVATVVKFASGTGDPQETGISLVGAGGVAVDAHGNILAVAENSCNCVREYAAKGYSLIRELDRTRQGKDPYAIAFGADQTLLYVAQYGNSGQAGYDVIRYADGVKLFSNTNVATGASSIALDPPAPLPK